MNEKQETITIICDNEDCRTKYVLSMDTLKAVHDVTVTCKKCGEIQQIILNKTGGIEIYLLLKLNPYSGFFIHYNS